MLYTTFTLLAAISGLASAAPVSSSTCTTTATASSVTATSDGTSPFPLANGFPNPSKSGLDAIAMQAHGSTPNTSPPTGLGADDITSLQLIAFNELFEVAFFTDLLKNITTGVYPVEEGDKAFLIEAITAVQGQEESHALAANTILKANGQEAIQPCKYKFPVSDLKSAITLASTVTDVALGFLQDVQLKLAKNGVADFVPVIGGVAEQEGEQNGYYRSYMHKIPSAAPYLTRATREFAFSVLQAFYVPGTCPNIELIKLSTFTPLNVLNKDIQPMDQTLRFSVDAKVFAGASPSLVYINQQNTPVVESPTNVVTQDGVTTFEAKLPFSEYQMYSLTIAALTKSAGPFADAVAVTADAIAGPGLIEIS